MLRTRWIASVVICAVAAAVLGGCGSSSSSGGPLQTELSYLPANSPLVLTIQTDPNGAAVKNTMAFLGRFSFAPLLESAVITRLKQAGVNYDADVKPLLGNPVTLALTSSSAFSHNGGGRNYVAVWVTKSSSALNSLIQRTSSGYRKLGTRGGATLYGSGGSTTIAVDGATLLIAPSRDAVIRALDRHSAGGGMSMASYSNNTAGLPADAEIQAFGNVQQLLTSNPRASSAIKIPWVAAIRGYGVAIGASSSGVSVNYHVDTTGSSLSSSQLPLSAGPVPELPTGFPVVAGLSDPQHLIRFAESAEQLASPAKWAKFERHQAALRAKTGTDLNAVLHQLTGTLVVASDLHGTFGRADVADPKATAASLAKLVKDPRDAFQTATVTRAGNAYVFKRPKGDLILELVGNRLVVGNKATAAQVHAFATVSSAPATGAQGPAAFSIALPELLKLATRTGGTPIPPALLGALGDLTGWAANTVSGLNGTASLGFK